MRRYFFIGKTKIILFIFISLWLVIFVITSSANKFNSHTILTAELLKRRTFASSTFINSDGTYIFKKNSEHIYYFDKYSNEFKEIDHTLRWSFQKRGWYFKTHNFHPFLPEYADQWIEFRDVFQDKDQTIRFKPICNHAAGRLILPENLSKEGLKGITDYNTVVYDNAFSPGIDLILYFTQTKFIKAVRIRKGFAAPNDMIFDFEINLPDDTAITAYNDYSNLINLEFSDNLQYLFNNPLRLGRSQNALQTYLKLQVWDEKNTEAIKFKLFEKNGRKYLRKIINKDFLNNSKGDIITDSTISYY
ncbi:MAG: hypothetical protein HQK91_11520 [Nitrospirae bacterium]|nr:hypothetical protein [Nitrospirota bacterium]